MLHRAARDRLCSNLAMPLTCLAREKFFPLSGSIPGMVDAGCELQITLVFTLSAWLRGVGRYNLRVPACSGQ